MNLDSDPHSELEVKNSSQKYKGTEFLTQTQIFQTINSLRLNNLCLKYISLQHEAVIISSNRIQSLKYPRSKTLGCKDKEIGKSEFVAKTQFLWARSV